MRLFVSAGAALAANYFLCLCVVFLPYSSFGRSRWIRVLGLWGCTVVVALYTWRHTASVSPGIVGCILLGAVVAGGIGFSAGFYGPIIFEPGAPQGPLVGIFFTGPLGFLVGAVGGAIYWRARGEAQGTKSD